MTMSSILLFINYVLFFLILWSGLINAKNLKSSTSTLRQSIPESRKQKTTLDKPLATSTAKATAITKAQVNESFACSPQSFKVSSLTWNLAEKSPQNCNFLKEFNASDIVVLGIQECEDIRPRRTEGHRSRAWRKIARSNLGRTHKCIAEHRMGGMQLAVYVMHNLTSAIQGYQIIDVACGVGNVLTNKGAICALLRINNKTIAVVNAHLAAHQTKVKDRNQNFHRIMHVIIEKAQTKWLSSSFAKLKLLREKAAKSSNAFTAQNLLASSQPWIDQMFTAVGIGSATDVATTIESKQEARKRLRRGKSPAKRRFIAPTVMSSSVKPRRRSPKSQSTAAELPDIWRPDGSSGCPFDAMIFLGDLNYRVDLPRLEIELFKEQIYPSAVASSTISNKYANVNLERKSTLLRTKTKAAKVRRAKPDAESSSTTAGTETQAKVATIPRLSIAKSICMTDASKAAQARNQLKYLLKFDQLKRQMSVGSAFRGFYEGEIDFMPTFKYDKGSDKFDSSSKGRLPAWTDRILFARSTPDASVVDGSDPSTSGGVGIIELLEYDSLDHRHSDHRPVFAKFLLNT